MELPLKSTLLDNLKSCDDGLPHVCVKEDYYIIPIDHWIEEVFNNIYHPWHGCVLIHNKKITLGVCQALMKVPTYFA